MSFFRPDAIKEFVREFNAQATPKRRTYPKISIITPSYNQAEFLEQTILSVLNQGYPNLEYIIMDGGSTDGSVEIIKKYEKYLTYWVSQKDGGQTSAINEGFRRATGEWVAFQNSDDCFAPNAFNSLIEGIDKHPLASIFYGHLLMLDENDVIFEHKKQMRFWREANVFEGMQAFNQSTFFKRGLLEKHGYLDENYKFAFDYEILCRWTHDKTEEILLLENFWGCFRQHTLAKSTLISDVGKSEHQHIKNKYSSSITPWFGEGVLMKIIKLRKILYFLIKGDLAYFKYRLAYRQKYQ